MRDKNLSIAERGMLLTLLSLPDNWELTIMGLCHILPDGKDKIARTLNALIDKGYVTREQSRGKGGRFASTDLEVHETLITPVQPHSGTGTVAKGTIASEKTSSCPTKSNTVIQNTDEPYAEDQSQYNTNISTNNIVNSHKVCKDDALTSDRQDLPNGFRAD